MGLVLLEVCGVNDFWGYVGFGFMILLLVVALRACDDSAVLYEQTPDGYVYILRNTEKIDLGFAGRNAVFISSAGFYGGSVK